MPNFRRSLSLVGLLGLAVAIAAACRGEGPAGREPGPPAAINGPGGDASAPAPVQITMHNVHLRMGVGISLDVGRLNGRMISRQPGQPPIFDVADSYTIDVDAAEVSMTSASVAALLNNRVFSRRGAALEELEINTAGRELELKGDLNKGIDVPFTMRATLSPAGGTRLRLRTTSLKTLGIPTKGVLEFFGIELDQIVETDDSPGVAASGDDLFLDAAAAFPPPRLHGEITAVRVANGRILMTLGSADKSPLPKPPVPDANYVFFKGSEIAFGKLTMHDSDLQLVDADPSDPFDFFPSHYERQLVAGYSKIQPDGGLVTFMPDFDEAAQTELPARPPAD